MSLETENLWGAMKGVYYERTMKSLKKSLREAQTLEASLSVALDVTVEAIHAVGGTFWFYDRYQDGRIYPKSVYGGGTLGGMKLLPGEGIAGTVIQNGKSVIIEDCQADPRWQGKVDDKTGFKTITMICVPLQYDDEVFGCIQIINKVDGMQFDEKDLAFAEALAAGTAQLFEESGVLRNYHEGVAHEAEQRRQIAFMQVMGAADLTEMEYTLRRIDEFSMLGVSTQQEVLALAKSMYAYFATGKKTGATKSRFGGMFGRRK